MRILITGGTGFIGQHLLDELRDSAISIRILTRKSSPQFWSANKNFELFMGDLNDKAALDAACNGVDAIVNLAAELKDASKMEAANSTGVKYLVSLSEKYKIKKIVHLSSVGVVGMQYSRKKIRVNEQTPCVPKNAYERTKLQAEQLLNEFAKKGTTEVIILRPSNVFGEHHPRQALHNFFQRIKNGSTFPMEKDAIVNYVYVKDVVHAIRHCLQNSIGSKTFAVGSSIHFEEFLKMGAGKMGTKLNTRTVPSFFFSTMEALGYFGMKNVRTKFRAISNHVEYDDDLMNRTIGYVNGLEKGIESTLNYYFPTHTKNK